MPYPRLLCGVAGSRDHTPAAGAVGERCLWLSSTVSAMCWGTNGGVADPAAIPRSHVVVSYEV
eukprot:6524562-Prorocentrum_lima.AAC.1